MNSRFRFARIFTIKENNQFPTSQLREAEERQAVIVRRPKTLNDKVDADELTKFIQNIKEY